MNIKPVAQVVALEPEGPDGHGVNWLAGKRPRPGALLYEEQDLNTLKVREFALESSCGHLGALIEELDEMLGWAYSQLHRVNYSKQEDALMLDSMKLRLLTRPLGPNVAS